MKTTNQIKIQEKQNLLKYSDIGQNSFFKFQAHSQQFQIKYEGKKNKSKLFNQVRLFLQKLIKDVDFYRQLQQSLDRNSKNNKKEQFKNISFKKVPLSLIKSKNFVQIQSNNNKDKTNKIEQVQLNKQRKYLKKISIAILCNNNQNQQQIFSSTSSLSDEQNDQNQIPMTMKQITLPCIKLSQQMIKQYFQSPSPFLITLSLSLLLRYCFARGSQPTQKDLPWILAVSTIEAFKFYFDQQLDGMFQCFQDVLNIDKKDLIDLQRCFLQKINYNIIVQNYFYQLVMEKFVQFQQQCQKQNNGNN